MFSDALGVAGGGVLVAGVYMWSLPAALIVGGALLILAAWRLS